MVNQGWTRQCHFCMAKEIVDHLLFGFFLAMVICQVIVSAFGLTIPHDTTFGMFGAWIASFPVSQPKKGGLSVVLQFTVQYFLTCNETCFEQNISGDLSRSFSFFGIISIFG